MRRLPDVIKRRIVEHLACHHTHAEVVVLILEEFDVPVTSRHIRVYDPTSLQFAGSHKWLDYYQSVRKRFASEIGEIAIAQRAYRMRQLQRLYEKAVERGDLNEARSALEQAAREAGNMFVRT